MEKLKRELLPENYYFIRNCAVGDEKIFSEERNFGYFMLLFEKYMSPLLEILAFCLLPGKFEFIVRIHNEDLLVDYIKKVKPGKENEHSKFLIQQLSNFFNAYTKAYNKVYERKGKLFCQSFSSELIRDYEVLRLLVHKVHSASISGGQVEKLGEWKFDSYGQNRELFREGNMQSEIVQLFGSEKGYMGFHEHPVRGVLGKSLGGV